VSSGDLPSISGIPIPVLSGTHNWTREHFVNRPDIEFLRDSVTGIEVYANATFQRISIVSGTYKFMWPVSGGNITSGVVIYQSGGQQINLSGVVISGISVSGVLSGIV
jgi:hypothetical protein